MRPWILSETNYHYLKQHQVEVAVLPFGATEPHNYHLPYSTDTLEANLLGEKICEVAYHRGAKVTLLPTIPYGTETNQREFPLSMNLNPSTLYQVVTDLVSSLAQSGIKKILLLNCHGGNDFKPHLRELYGLMPEVKLFLCNFYTVLSDVYDQIFEHSDDHAGEMETSIILAYHPELVGKNDDGSLIADDGMMAKTQFEAVNNAWVTITRPWHLLTTNSGAGYPHAASAEKGHQAVEIIAQRISDFLVELASAKIDDSFPFSAKNE